MRNILRIHGSPVLNFRELQQNFSPMELYGQLDVFADFAQIHCVPLPVILEREETGERYVAQGFTKAFWYKILRTVLCDENYDPSEVFYGLLQNTKEEAEDSQILRKLDHICQKTGKKDEYREALVILAICELSEVDPRNTEWGSVKKSGEGSAAGSLHNAEPGITFFPYENTAALAVGGTYRYWYYEDETLGEGSLIQTVKVAASAGLNHYASARIELYQENTGQCIYTLELKEGEYKYCTVSQGRIIEFLPDISLSDDLCLLRPDYSSDTIKAVPKNGESWRIDGGNVSCYAAGTMSQGFLLLRSGKVKIQFYKAAAADYHKKLQLETIIVPAVGVRIRAAGYEVLLEDGTVVSDQPQKRRLHEVSLYPRNRFPYPKERTSGEYRESAVSDSGRSRAALAFSKESERIHFG